MSRALYIFDIDGTLANIEHRKHLIERPKCLRCDGLGSYVARIMVEGDGRVLCSYCNGTGRRPGFKPNWDAFYDACVDDMPNEPVVRTLALLANRGVEIWLFTGRTERVREQTRLWLMTYTVLTEYELDYGQLVMRPNGDFRRDDILKQEMLDHMLNQDRNRLIAVFDDRQQVVDMWRRNGIACFQVAPGDF